MCGRGQGGAAHLLPPTDVPVNDDPSHALIAAAPVEVASLHPLTAAAAVNDDPPPGLHD